MQRDIRLMYVVGARPNFMKVAPVMSALDTENRDCDVRFDQVLIHTGQHYDDRLSRVFFDQLALREPDENLGVGSGSQAQQTARLLEALETAMLRHRPDLVVVPGDVNSTCAGALAAAKLCIPVAHLEAGLRSGDRSMPEEINRIVADHVAELLLTTCADADANLVAEGISRERIDLVGNTMIDSLVRLADQAQSRAHEVRAELALGDEDFVLVTLHRPSNVDVPEQLARLMEVLQELTSSAIVVFPVHPRTRERLALVPGYGIRARQDSRLLLTEPLGYLEFLGLMMGASAVVTDSGGVQEETTVLGVPCVTVRTTTERPITISQGTNRLVDPHDPGAILDATRQAITRGVMVHPPHLPLWDGSAALRVAAALERWTADRD